MPYKNPLDPRRRETQRRYQDAHRVELILKNRDYRAATKRKRAQAYQKIKHKLRPRQRNAHLRRSYGIDDTAVRELLVLQHGKCAICQQPFTTVPHVDHCHLSGRVRGLLCRTCNVGLGGFKDNPEFLLRAIEYLSCHASTTLNTWSIQSAKQLSLL